MGGTIIHSAGGESSSAFDEYGYDPFTGYSEEFGPMGGVRGSNATQLQLASDPWSYEANRGAFGNRAWGDLQESERNMFTQYLRENAPVEESNFKSSISGFLGDLKPIFAGVGGYMGASSLLGGGGLSSLFSGNSGLSSLFNFFTGGGGGGEFDFSGNGFMPDAVSTIGGSIVDGEGSMGAMDPLEQLRRLMRGKKGGGLASNMMDIGSGLYGLYSAGNLEDTAEEAAAGADPFAATRPQYIQQLAQLSADPSMITKLPGYGAGIQAVNRGMAAGGYLGSGNQMAALQQYGQNAYAQEIARLMAMAQMGNPAASEAIRMRGAEGATSMRGNALNRIIYGARGFFS